MTAGTFTAQQAMDRLAGEMDELMARMQVADEKAKAIAAADPLNAEGTRPIGSARGEHRGPSSTTKSRRAKPSTTTSWSSAGRADSKVPSRGRA